MSLKLDIGCGEYRITPEHIGIDPYAPGVENRAQMWELPYEADSVDEIWCTHALEHIPQAKVVPTLQEWKRVIKPGGLITLHVPSLRWCCQNFLDHEGQFALWTLYGQQNREGEYHLTGFTPDMTKEYIAEAGLTLLEHNVLFTHAQETLEFKVTK